MDRFALRFFFLRLFGHWLARYGLFGLWCVLFSIRRGVWPGAVFHREVLLLFKFFVLLLFALSFFLGELFEGRFFLFAKNFEFTSEKSHHVCRLCGGIFFLNFITNVLVSNVEVVSAFRSWRLDYDFIIVWGIPFNFLLNLRFLLAFFVCLFFCDFVFVGWISRLSSIRKCEVSLLFAFGQVFLSELDCCLVLDLVLLLYFIWASFPEVTNLFEDISLLLTVLNCYRTLLFNQEDAVCSGSFLWHRTQVLYHRLRCSR